MLACSTIFETVAQHCYCSKYLQHRYCAKYLTDTSSSQTGDSMIMSDLSNSSVYNAEENTQVSLLNLMHWPTHPSIFCALLSVSMQYIAGANAKHGEPS